MAMQTPRLSEADAAKPAGDCACLMTLKTTAPESSWSFADGPSHSAPALAALRMGE